MRPSKIDIALYLLAFVILVPFAYDYVTWLLRQIDLIDWNTR